LTLHRRDDYAPIDFNDTISTGLATPSRGAKEGFVAGQRTRPGGHGPLHQHDVEEDTLLLEGAAEVQVAEKTVRMEPGDVLIVPADTLHQMRNPRPEPTEYLITSRAGVVHSWRTER
jgi:mannose-6-phosphate isomerase-like protein (cupin superfamily)